MDPHTDFLVKLCTAFGASSVLAAGPLVEVVLAVKTAVESGSPDSYLVFEDATGRTIDFDLRGTKSEVIARLSRHPLKTAVPPAAEAAAPGHDAGEPRGRGRPRLGVVGREVTLLPRQWQWLAAQPGGASVVLRRLVDEAKRDTGGLQRTRVRQEAAYRFMSAMAGDRPGFEEATRALFASDPERFARQTAAWPAAVRAYAQRLAFEPPAHEPPAV